MSNEIVMEANELMHGDYVRRKKNKEIVRVFEIDGERGLINNEADGYDSERHIRINEIEPIPLTPEILEKNGFEIKPFYADLQVVEGTSAYRVRSNLRQLAIKNGACSLDIHCRYFHELQHAFRLCGIKKELTITED